jgi:hypothetical protein
MTYKVMVDENNHLFGDSGSYTHGQFDTYEQAESACRRIVDEFLTSQLRPGTTAQGLYSAYKLFGEDPYIISEESCPRFSGWDYARERCIALCANNGETAPATGS